MKVLIAARYVVLMSVIMVGGRALAFAQAVPPAPQNDPQAHAEHHPEGEAPKAEAPKPAPAKDMMASCMEMMSQRESMMKQMDAMDKKLDELVAQMNQAKGNQKIDALAKAVTEMAAQRKQMRQETMKMEDGMMAHMMEHMQNGSAMCPMMKGKMMNSSETKKE